MGIRIRLGKLPDNETRVAKIHSDSIDNDSTPEGRREETPTPSPYDSYGLRVPSSSPSLFGIVRLAGLAGFLLDSS